MVKVGDRVRFLNSVGGGIVKKINKDIALVEEEDGVETPVLLRECVVIEAGKKYSDPVPEKRTDSPQISRNIIQEEEEEAEDQLPLLETPKGERLNIISIRTGRAEEFANHTFRCLFNKRQQLFSRFYLFLQN